MFKLFPPKSIDSAFIQDVIEHIPKKTAKKLLDKTEKITKHQIVIFTPLGFVKQEHSDGVDAWGMSGAKWQKHRSGWQPSDFDQTWDIYACKNYHTQNNLGEKVDEFGAFYAIKNISSPQFSFMQKTQIILHRTLDNIFMIIYKFIKLFK